MNTYKSKIIVPCAEYYKFINVDDIIRLEAMQNYTRIYLKDEKPILSSYNIGIYVSQLNKSQFYNCHKSHLINKKLINRYFKDGYVEMCDNSKIPVSRRRKAKFVEEVISGLIPKRKSNIIYLGENKVSPTSLING